MVLDLAVMSSNLLEQVNLSRFTKAQGEEIRTFLLRDFHKTEKWMLSFYPCLSQLASFELKRFVIFGMQNGVQNWLPINFRLRRTRWYNYAFEVFQETSS